MSEPADAPGGAELHRRIGLLAYQRSYLPLARLFEAWTAVGRRPEATPYDVWIQEGFLDRTELAEILHAVEAPGISTLPTVDGASMDASSPSHGSLASVDLADVLRTYARESESLARFTEDHLAKSEPDESPPEELPASDGTGRYLIGGELGRGGNGIVVRAFDRVVGRSVAMKLLQHAQPSPEAISSFLEEAQATGQLEHPGIVPVYDVGRLQDGRVFYTMKRLRSHSLRAVLRGLALEDPRIVDAYGQGRLLTIFLQVCRAIQYAHDRGVIHRDLKPENIMLGDYGEVHVMDWGLAHITRTGVVTERSLQRKQGAEKALETFGTPAYMSPEQARGDLDDVTEQSDVYALGLILYELMTLRQPAMRSTVFETMMAVLHDPVPPPSSIDSGRIVHEELERIIMRAVEKDPVKRWTSVRAMHDALERFLDGRNEREAERHLLEGERRIRLYEQAVDEVGRLSASIREFSARIADHEPLDRKRPLWELEDLHEAAHTRMISAFNDAFRELNQALAHVPEQPAVKAALSRIFWSRYQLAVAERSLSDQLTFEAYLRQVDDGTWLRLLDHPATLTVTSSPSEAVVFVHRFEEENRVRIPQSGQFVGRTPLELELERGPWLLRFKQAGHPPVSVPIQIHHAEPRHVHAWLPPREVIPEGAVHVPGGVARLGGDREALDSLPLVEQEIAPFLIQRHPTTFREYCAFLDALAQEDVDKARQRAPRTRDADGILTEMTDDHRFHPHPILIEGPMRELYPEDGGHEWQLPVVAISYDDALAYAAWRSSVDGIAWRLPTELEWEYAARGADERLFPWGDRFDATFCKMNASRAMPSQPEPVGAFPMDRSVFGVCDMAGGVREWTLAGDPEALEIVLRGGAWALDSRLCRVASRSHCLRDARLSVNGFRLAASLSANA